MKLRQIFTLLALILLPSGVWADIAPSATYTDSSGSEVTIWDDFTAEAPLHVIFRANPSFLDEGAGLEWHFRHQGASGSNDYTRYEEDTEFDFTESGLTEVSLLVRLDNEVIDSMSIRITISESHLEMPNAFSPNDDGVNDVYGAKGIKKNGGNSSGAYKSIVDFHAYIFNRWGQKLYEWTDIEGYWDGTFNGSPVKDGVYFVLVKARGADGIEYNIRRDVNLMRKKNVSETNSGGNE